MRKKLLFTITLCFFMLNTFQTFAQAIKGFVYDKETGEPVIFANIVIDELKKGTTTDINGYYSFSNLEDGNYSLTFSFIGYETQKKQVEIAGSTLNLKVFLSESDNILDEVELSAEAMEKRTEVNVAKINITPNQIKRLPSVGGQADLAQFIQVLPGVVFTGDQGGQLYIRGGTPVQNLVLLDGMTIYSPFHSIGFTSVFDTDLIKNADVYTAAFGAEYGGRTSSVIDIKTKDGNKKKLSGKFSANTFGAKMTLEGPLAKPNKDGLSNSTFILSAKKSYIDKTAELLYDNAIQPRETTIPFAYTDLYSKITFGSESGTKLSLYGFNFRDNVDYASQTSFDWKSTGFGGNIVAVLPNSLSIINMDFNYSDYTINEIAKKIVDGNYIAEAPKTSNINEFKFNFNVRRNIDDTKSFKLGVNFGGGSTNFEYKNSNLIDFDLKDNTTFFSAYYLYKYNSSLWVFEPSIRATAYTGLGEFAFEPRMSTKYNLNEKLRLKASAGFYSQNLIAANSGRQVVNLFNGFISSPDDLPVKFNNETVDSKLQNSFHAVLGAEIDVNKNFDINVETYIKNKYELININLEKVSPKATETQNFTGEEWRLHDFQYEKGKAYGVDVTFNYRKGRFSANSTYSLGLAEIENEQYRKYNPHYDRRHNINLTGSYMFNKDKSLVLDMRFNYGSGFPFSQIIGNYEGVNPSNVSGDYLTLNGESVSLYGAPDGGRLPDYMRLDLSLTKTYKLSKNQMLELNFTVTNLTNRENIFYFDKINDERINQLPIMPSFGANWSF